MKYLFLFLLLLPSAPLVSQHAVTRITLRNGSVVSGLALSVRATAVLLHTEPWILEKGILTADDTSYFLQCVVVVPFADIAFCTIERTSHLWVAGLLMIPFTAFGGNELAAATDVVARGTGTLIGIGIGLLAAATFQALTSSDLSLDIANPEDIKTFRSYAVVQGPEPPILHALE